MEALFEELKKVKDESLTGRYYHKQGFFGLTLFVEYKYTIHDGSNPLPMTRWRSATSEDLKELNLKAL